MLHQHSEQILYFSSSFCASITLAKVAVSKCAVEQHTSRNLDGVCVGARDCAGHPAGPAPGPSGRVAHGVASAAAVSAFALLAPDSAAASESASAGILALLASACSVVCDTAKQRSTCMTVLGIVAVQSGVVGSRLLKNSSCGVLCITSYRFKHEKRDGKVSCPQERLQEMGPYGPLLFVVTVACAELIPLFPTQPLSLASGLLFGPRLVRLRPLFTV